MTRIVVIGKTGQLARALGECEVPGAEMVFLGRDRLDLTDASAIEPTILAAAPDLVINAAAYTAVDRAETEPELAHRVNGAAVGEIAAAAAAADAPLVHVSTDYVYDGSKMEPYTEEDPTAPINRYGATKLAGENTALAANPRTVILRTAWVYAPWGRNFLLTMLRLARERAEIRVVDDQRDSPTSALELANAIAAIAPRLIGEPDDGSIWGAYHYTGKGETSWAGFAHTIFAGAESRGLIETVPRIIPITSAEYPTPAARPANSVLDCTKFERSFAVKSRPWEEALARVLDRLRKETVN